ncbi:BON domain-containing protein [Anaeromyxobacter sp. Fw109-5]|uniref:BON domain-containing protein n=1 Tax=Anaeromyxobacter sp. (strain Fw109-5) TaxID=404589 RepID=UPI0000ED7644|nr:BON domain-containing protein [Anaeromyxobacter sp. Fw109-5]ABS25919.1 transport-associated [Anaeromyxobacter sp. Fw109-5]
MARGPKGWRRSDERILDELCERIVRSGVDASDVEVAVERGVLRLRGIVPHPDDRRLLVELASAVLGVEEIEDEVTTARDAALEPDPETVH